MRVMRFVSEDEEHNFLHRDVYPGEIFYKFTLPTYGCVDDFSGVALSEREDEYPFFQFPRDAVEPAELVD